LELRVNRRRKWQAHLDHLCAASVVAMKDSNWGMEGEKSLISN